VIKDKNMRQKLIFADQLRSLAIISVLISHYFGIFWFDPQLKVYINSLETLDTVVPKIIEMIN
jgi:peptidoglycan/LPS O-acetylase OafA/YrhL